MSPVERRPNERAMHEVYLVVKAAPGDMGSRPLQGPFASPDVTVGLDGRPRAVVWNLGTREVAGVVTEFATVPAGMPVRSENMKVIGYGNSAIIPANSSVTVTCTSIWPRMSSADVLLVTVCHPDLDPIRAAGDPLVDRHVAQMNYAWAGRYEGKLGGSSPCKVAIEIRPANKGLYRVRFFQAIEGRMPSNPQVDRIMAPNGHTFRWLETLTSRKELYDLTIQDNQSMTLKVKTRLLEEPGKPDLEQTGLVERA